MTKKLKERVLVDYIGEFFLANLKNSKSLNAASPEDVEKGMTKRIKNFVQSKHLPEDDANTLERALWIQHYAGLHVKKTGRSSSTRSDSWDGFIFLPYPYYGWGGCCGYHHHTHWGSSGSISGSDMDGKGLLVLLAIVMCACAIAASVGMTIDLVEMGSELSHGQRVASNLATLSLTAAYIVGAVLICISLFAANPVVGVIAAAALVIGMALLVKGVRVLANLIEGSLDAKSGVLSDSRFQLTEREESHLKKQLEAHGIDPEKIAAQIDGIKGIIRSLSLQARVTDETRFFGSNAEYLDIINVLNKVKKGELTPQLKNQYRLTDFPDLGTASKSDSKQDQNPEPDAELEDNWANP